MIDSDQRPDSNQRPLLKSGSTDVIFSDKGILKLASIQILRSMADFLVRVRAYISDVIGRLFENWTPI